MPFYLRISSKHSVVAREAQSNVAHREAWPRMIPVNAACLDGSGTVLRRATVVEI